MPEIAEVARVVHYLKQSLVGKRIGAATALDDPNVFGKVGTTGKEVEAALRGRKVTSAGSQGKYFWITLDKPPHLVLHLGMTGWVHIHGEQTPYTNYRKKMKDGEAEEWPPKFWKFHLTTTDKPPVHVAFTDSRRFGRVRLIHCPESEIRAQSPLKENGPDPVVDLKVFTESYLSDKMRSRHVPIKALLLDQTVISGIGNWVADETLYHAKIHPEQYCDSFDDEEMRRLYDNIRYVCQTAVDALADSDSFPDHWLFNHRWGKGAKGAATALPNGDKLAFITVGGRTSCYAPERQRKTGKVAPGAKAELVEDAENDVKVDEDAASKPKGKAGDGRTAKQKTTKPIKRKEATDSKRTAPNGVDESSAGDQKLPKVKKAKTASGGEGSVVQDNGRRRSARLRG